MVLKFEVQLLKENIDRSDIDHVEHDCLEAGPPKPPLVERAAETGHSREQQPERAAQRGDGADRYEEAFEVALYF